MDTTVSKITPQRIVLILVVASVALTLVPFKKSNLVIIDEKTSIEIQVSSRPIENIFNYALRKENQNPLIDHIRYCDGVGRACVFKITHSRVFFSDDVRILSNRGKTILIVDSRGSETVSFEFQKMDEIVSLEIGTMASKKPVFAGESNLKHIQ